MCFDSVSPSPHAYPTPVSHLQFPRKCLCYFHGIYTQDFLYHAKCRICTWEKEWVNLSESDLVCLAWSPVTCILLQQSSFFLHCDCISMFMCVLCVCLYMCVCVCAHVYMWVCVCKGSMSDVIFCHSPPYFWDRFLPELGAMLIRLRNQYVWETYPFLSSGIGIIDSCPHSQALF